MMKGLFSPKKKQEDPFFTFLKTLADPNTNSAILVKLMLQFQKDVTMKTLSNYQASEIHDFLKMIWNALLHAAMNDSSSIRISAYRATVSFLIKITPYYPDKIYASFSEVVQQATIDIRSSPVLTSAFSFISTFIAPPFLPNFLNSTPISHHFSTPNTVFDEHLPPIISTLGHLGLDWCLSLLHCFLDKISIIGATPPREMVRAIASLIRHYPQPLLSELLSYIIKISSDDETQNEQGDQQESTVKRKGLKQYIIFLAFILKGESIHIEHIDLLPVAIAAAEILLENPSVAEMDSAFQLLSLESDSFTVKIEEKDTNILSITVLSQGESKATSTITISSSSGRPSLYLLELPLNFLMISNEDSSFVATEKLKTIGTLVGKGIIPLKDVYHIFKTHLLTDFNDLTSPTLQGFSKCANQLIQEAPSTEIIRIVRKSLLCKPASWFHAFDILHVVDILDPNIVTKYLGGSIAFELIDVTIGFAFYENENLQEYAKTVIVKKLSKFDANVLHHIFHTITKRTDFLLPQELERSLSLMTAIIHSIEKNPIKHAILSKNSDLSWYIEATAEAAGYYYDRLTTLTEIFDFLNTAEGSKQILKPLAANVVRAFFEVISGTEWRDFGSLPRFENETNSNLKEIASQYISMKCGDLVVQNQMCGNPNSLYLRPMKVSLQYFLKYANVKDGFRACEKVFPLLPYECSLYIAHHWSSDPSAKIVAQSLLSRLQFVGDLRVHSIWSKVWVENGADESFGNTTALLNLVSTTELYSQKVKNIALTYKEAASFAAFLVRFGNQSEQNSTETINPEIRVNSEFCLEMAKHFKSQCSHYGIDADSILQKELSNQMEEVPITIEKDVVDSSKLTKEEIQPLFEKSIQTLKYQTINHILNAAKMQKIKISIGNIEFPEHLIPQISKYIAENQPDTFSGIEALRYVRSPWRKAAITGINREISLIISELQKFERIKKKVIINITSSLSDLNITSDQLLQLLTLSIDILKKENNEQTSVQRVHYALTLIASALEKFPESTIPNEFSTSFMNAVNPIFNYVSPFPLSMILIKLTNSFINSNNQSREENIKVIEMAKKVIDLSGQKSTTVANLHQVLASNYSNVMVIGSNYLLDLNDVISSYMHSAMPSLFCGGLRLTKVLINNIPPAQLNVMLRIVIDPCLVRYAKMSQNGGVAQILSEIVSMIQAHEGIPAIQDIIRRSVMPLPCIFFAPPKSPGYCDSLKIIIPVLKDVDMIMEFYSKLNEYALNLFAVPSLPVFNIAIESVKIRIDKMNQFAALPEDDKKKKKSKSVETIEPNNVESSESSVDKKADISSILKVISEANNIWLKSIQEIDTYSIFSEIHQWSQLLGNSLPFETAVDFAIKQYSALNEKIPVPLSILYFELSVIIKMKKDTNENLDLSDLLSNEMKSSLRIETIGNPSAKDVFKSLLDQF